MIGLDFSVLAPLGFVSIGAMAVLLLDGLLSRSFVPGMSARKRLLTRSRIGTYTVLPGCAIDRSITAQWVNRT